MSSVDITPGPITATAPQVPVRDGSGKPLPADVIRAYVLLSMQYMRAHPSESFRVLAKGWPYPVRIIAPMWDYAPDNCCLPLYEWMRN